MTLATQIVLGPLGYFWGHFFPGIFLGHFLHTYDTFIAEDLTIDMISCQEQLFWDTFLATFLGHYF